MALLVSPSEGGLTDSTDGSLWPRDHLEPRGGVLGIVNGHLRLEGEREGGRGGGRGEGGRGEGGGEGGMGNTVEMTMRMELM